ncbi:molybdopterin molybdotransferase MoeA [Parvularcula sp. LCG005]|uniref:molybdopterin molybdotransferase MoeA n=1 Tax=Parvularcula sp. LCG005 TaxID=3078805 RepID=UPI002942F6F8|nr:molybdopterin molybdotransferase MoeA [Parvularcula sp. LCG005]WOI52204.1 molybdopterin molybdotransferase MoeA [Parvularcula sp. LCG005]
MISVDEAVATIATTAKSLETEGVPLTEAPGRVLREDVHARVSQPPASVSAMDGYAICWTGPCTEGQTFRVIGEAPAGRPFSGAVSGGDCVRLYTGSVVPAGANHVIIQEHVERTGDTITLTSRQPEPRNIRPEGGDFRRGDPIASAGTMIDAALAGLIAAANVDSVLVTRCPRVALIANGDELHPPGSPLPTGAIVNSAPFALAPLLRTFGASVDFLGIAEDNQNAIKTMFDAARDYDVVIPIGGASVGDYDHMKEVARTRYDLLFEKVAVKPGKPTWYGTSVNRQILGLPGNPASAITCALLFAKPLVATLLGDARQTLPTARALLTTALPANGPRETYLRGSCFIDDQGSLRVTPQADQDSSLLRPYAASNALIKREPKKMAAEIGGQVQVIFFGRL